MPTQAMRDRQTECSRGVVRRNVTGLFFFFFNDTATTEIYTLSLHDALPIYHAADQRADAEPDQRTGHGVAIAMVPIDRKSTRLNSSHLVISYAVFCLKKKNCNGIDSRRLPTAHQRYPPIRSAVTTWHHTART